MISIFSNILLLFIFITGFPLKTNPKHNNKYNFNDKHELIDPNQNVNTMPKNPIQTESKNHKTKNKIGFNGASVSSAAATNAFVSDSNFTSVFGNTEPAGKCNIQPSKQLI